MTHREGAEGTGRRALDGGGVSPSSADPGGRHEPSSTGEGLERESASEPEALPLPPAPSLAKRLGYLTLDLLGIAGWTWMGILLPLPVVSDYLNFKNALVAFLAILWVGRTIVDTCFYDRYR